jgi:hypothetical protein
MPKRPANKYDRPCCAVCKTPFKTPKSIERSRRNDGRLVCPTCWGSPDRERYRNHWFVKDLQFQKPSLKIPRSRKPLRGQRRLF